MKSQETFLYDSYTTEGFYVVNPYSNNITTINLLFRMKSLVDCYGDNHERNIWINPYGHSSKNGMKKKTKKCLIVSCEEKKKYLSTTSLSHREKKK